MTRRNREPYTKTRCLAFCDEDGQSVNSFKKSWFGTDRRSFKRQGLCSVFDVWVVVGRKISWKTSRTVSAELPPSSPITPCWEAASSSYSFPWGPSVSLEGWWDISVWKEQIYLHWSPLIFNPIVSVRRVLRSTDKTVEVAEKGRHVVVDVNVVCT